MTPSKGNKTFKHQQYAWLWNSISFCHHKNSSY